jgi:hypothetical protein
MELRFTRHYSRAQARALLPEIRAWLAKLRLLQPILEQHERALGRLLEQGRDVGGERVHIWLRTLIALRTVLREFARREIQIKDLQRGLIDFPALLGDKEVFLCWEEGEQDVEFWHDLDAGYAGRSPL